MNSKMAVLSAVIILSVFLATAQAELKPAAMGSAEAQAEPNNLQFPYVGQITGSGVNVRSGPGMQYYSCGKISSPDRVIVVAQEYSWSQILPPPGSFSWVFKQYVQTDANRPGIGVVNADNVRVYAGSDEVEAMRSDTVQQLLTRGQKVQILGEAGGDYYKITPPTGATLWTTSQYIKYIRSADTMDIQIPKFDANTAARPDMIVEQVGAKNRWLVQYYDMEDLFEKEKAKPLAEQDYSKIRTELELLIADPNSGEAGEYAKFLLKAAERCELAKESQTELAEQKGQLGEKIEKIEKENEEEKANIRNVGKYAVTGVFRQSAVYEKEPEITRRFLITDSNDNPLCYAEPVAADANLADYYDKQVGLIGKIITDKQSNLALVKFDEIELLEKE